MKNKLKEKYIGIAKEHFESEILPQFKEILGDDCKKVLVFVSGSVSHGYVDKISDIDMGVLFFGDVVEGKIERIKPLLKDYWVDSIRLSYWNEERNKNRIKSIYEGDIDKIWENPAIYFFFDTLNYYPIFDQNNILKSVQDKILFYPEDFAKKVIRGLWITANDSGVYIAEQCVERNKNTEGYISFYRGLEATLRLIYLLNRKYFAPTKWLTMGLDFLENDFGVKKFLKKIKGNNLKKDLKQYELFIGKIKDYMLKNETLEKLSIENCWSILKNNLPWHVYSTF